MTYAHTWLLLLIPVYLLFEVLNYYFIRSDSTNLPTAATFRQNTTWRIILVRVLPLLIIATALLLILSAARPQNLSLEERFQPSGIDIVVAIDTSGSMAAEDFQPNNRLFLAKDVLKDFILGRPSDRIGLVIFGGRATTRAPLTLDHASLVRSLDSIDFGLVPDGTAIGSAIMTSLNRLAQPKKEKGENIVVLLTDGRNNAGEIHPADALQLAIRQKIKIYTIGVGSYGKVPFPVYTADGKKTYRYERAEIDEPLLKQVAEKTGGTYFRATDANSLAQLFARINTLEKSEPRVEKLTVIREHYRKYLLPAGILISLFTLATFSFRRYP